MKKIIINPEKKVFLFDNAEQVCCLKNKKTNKNSEGYKGWA